MKKIFYFVFITLLSLSNSYSQELFLENFSYGSNGVVYSESSVVIYASFGRSIVGTAKSGNKIISINSTSHFPKRESTVTSNNIAGNIPKQFSLQQNYPNPFNPSTNIRYDVPKQSHVTISIFNILGEKILELVNEEKAAGSYEVTWNAHNLSNGVYVYTMRSGNFVDSKKLILLK